VPRSKVEMIMNPNSPAFGEQIGRGDWPAIGEAGTQGTSVMSKVRSSRTGLVLDCALSTYFQVPG